MARHPLARRAVRMPAQEGARPDDSPAGQRDFHGADGRGGKRSQIPHQLLVHVVLHVGHRVGKDAYMQRIALLTADVVPDLREQVASGFTLTLVVMQLHPLADPGHRGVGGHEQLLHRRG
ncbi:hypothetical protein [Nonomuraea sp. NPDC049400]|uniref:hypothetical protein n=1 Tax=Nonomuraea sp. NPDC049400 TaxID=3364352 RepID=UPI00378A2081